MIRRRAVLAALLGVVVLLAGYLGITRAPRDTSPTVARATPTPTATIGEATPTAGTTTPPSAIASATLRPSATPDPVALDARYGWYVRNVQGGPPKIRRETAPAPLRSIEGDNVVVSSDGQRIAYWGPPGVRRQLFVADATGGPERLVLTLPDSERGNGVAWSTDGTGLAIQVDSTSTPQGGVDPPPAYSAIRIVDVLNGTTREIVRQPLTRLVPFGWVRERRLITAARSLGAEAGPTAYLRIGEDGSVRESSLGSDFCVHAVDLRLNTLGTRVLSVHPSRCSTGSDPSPDRPSFVRTWPVDDPASALTLDAGRVHLVDATFRPRTEEIAISTYANATLRIDVWTRATPRRIADVTVGRGPPHGMPVVFRPEGDRAFVVYQPDSFVNAWRVRLVDLNSGGASEAEVGAEAPEASVLLRAPPP